MLLGSAIFSSLEVSTAAAVAGVDAGCGVARNISGLKANFSLCLRVGFILSLHVSLRAGSRRRGNLKGSLCLAKEKLINSVVCHCLGCCCLESGREDDAGVCESRDCS